MKESAWVTSAPGHDGAMPATCRGLLSPTQCNISNKLCESLQLLLQCCSQCVCRHGHAEPASARLRKIVQKRQIYVTGKSTRDEGTSCNSPCPLWRKGGKVKPTDRNQAQLTDKGPPVTETGTGATPGSRSNPGFSGLHPVHSTRWFSAPRFRI